MNGDTVLRATYDGELDRAGSLPQIAATSYYAVRVEQLVSLLIAFQPPTVA